MSEIVVATFEIYMPEGQSQEEKQEHMERVADLIGSKLKKWDY